MSPCVSRDRNSEVMSYRQDIKNYRLHFDRNNKTATLYLADGGTRLYKKNKRLLGFWNGVYRRCDGLGREYLLAEEISASGQKTLYHYDDTSMTVQHVNPAGDKVFAELKIHQLAGAPYFRIKAEGSDNKEIRYHGVSKKRRCYLNTINRDDYPRVACNYTKDTTSKNHFLESMGFIWKRRIKGCLLFTRKVFQWSYRKTSIGLQSKRDL